VNEWLLKIYILAMATNNLSLDNVVLLEVVFDSSYAFTFAFLEIENFNMLFTLSHFKYFYDNLISSHIRYR
jgi:hypothetical protein